VRLVCKTDQRDARPEDLLLEATEVRLHVANHGRLDEPARLGLAQSRRSVSGHLGCSAGSTRPPPASHPAALDRTPPHRRVAPCGAAVSTRDNTRRI